MIEDPESFWDELLAFVEAKSVIPYRRRCFWNMKMYSIVLCFLMRPDSLRGICIDFCQEVTHNTRDFVIATQRFNLLVLTPGQFLRKLTP